MERENNSLSPQEIIHKEYIRRVDDESFVPPQLIDVFRVTIHSEKPHSENWSEEHYNRLVATYLSNMRSYYFRWCSDVIERGNSELTEYLQDKISSIDEEMDALSTPFSDDELLELY